MVYSDLDLMDLLNVGLQFYEVTETGPRIVSPAPRSFSGSLF